MTCRASVSITPIFDLVAAADGATVPLTPKSAAYVAAALAMTARTRGLGLGADHAVFVIFLIFEDI